MNTRRFVVGAMMSLAVSAPSAAAGPRNPMGIAIGNLLVGDYGKEGKVTGAFDKDGSVMLTFPDGTKRRQSWVADARYFCMIVAPGADGKMSYRCERNMIKGKAIGQQWRQIDSESLAVTMSVQPRP